MDINIKTYYILPPHLDQSITIVKYLRRYKSNVNIIGMTLSSKNVPSYIRNHYDKIIFKSNLKSTPVGRVIPTGAIATRFMLERGDITVGEITLTKEALRVYDKPWMIEKAKEAGLYVPLTWCDVSDLERYPIFYKQRYETGGGGKRGFARKLSEIPDDCKGPFIFQEVIEGEGVYGVGFLSDNGKIITYNIHYERESLPKAGGSAVFIEHYYDERLVKHTRNILKSIDYSGWGLVEFKYCPKRKDYVFMEINAKFWASCEFTFINNPKFLKLLFDIDAGVKPVQKMVFVNRALRRNFIFACCLIISNIFRASFSISSGLLKDFLASLLPKRARGIVSLFIKKLKVLVYDYR